jgi:hypothetical protein
MTGGNARHRAADAKTLKVTLLALFSFAFVLGLQAVPVNTMMPSNAIKQIGFHANDDNYTPIDKSRKIMRIHTFSLQPLTTEKSSWFILLFK